ncbi:hypothetical protein ElyMa_003143500 [Elysia marginata]|uniref:Uncharacterized protein n=1 Tax=Elysia marginata TaxID=1093978 RepID=A0AAV4IWX3_9GAST|nr:hypothetical protein ElyMa_003143500 [Elysia marginata]
MGGQRQSRNNAKLVLESEEIVGGERSREAGAWPQTFFCHNPLSNAATTINNNILLVLYATTTGITTTTGSRQQHSTTTGITTTTGSRQQHSTTHTHPSAAPAISTSTFEPPRRMHSQSH